MTRNYPTGPLPAHPAPQRDLGHTEKEFEMAEFGQRRIQEVQIKMPDTEDLIPDAPTDAIGRYATVLLQWEALTRRQAKYEEELRKLQAAGDALAAEWDSLAAERQHCLEAFVGTLALPPHEVIERVWDIFKAQLLLHIKVAERQRSSTFQSLPFDVTAMAEPLARNPRIVT
jgi:hypothetical protein